VRLKQIGSFQQYKWVGVRRVVGRNEDTAIGCHRALDVFQSSHLDLDQPVFAATATFAIPTPESDP